MGPVANRLSIPEAQTPHCLHVCILSGQRSQFAYKHVAMRQRTSRRGANNNPQAFQSDHQTSPCSQEEINQHQSRASQRGREASSRRSGNTLSLVQAVQAIATETSRLAYLRPRCMPCLQTKNLNEGIAKFYDESSGLWESMWGEHMHHGNVVICRDIHCCLGSDRTIPVFGGQLRPKHQLQDTIPKMAPPSPIWKPRLT